jgi:tryptophan synthase alpha chain
MNPLITRLDALRTQGAHAFIPFLTAGYPDAPRFRDLLRACGAADCIEIGLPFSDPVADGPTVCRASEIALAQGMHSDALFDLLGAEREHPPVVLMTYLNPVLAYGVERFMRRAHQAGVAALLLTDVPADEGAELAAAAAAQDLAMVQLVAPTTAPDRIARIAAAATGFVYCVALAGTTGARSAVAAAARSTVERVRAVTDRPVIVGFGISTPEHVREVCAYADGVVVGSALLDWVHQHRDDPRLGELFSAHLTAFAAAAHGG